MQTLLKILIVIAAVLLIIGTGIVLWQAVLSHTVLNAVVALALFIYGCTTLESRLN